MWLIVVVKPWLFSLQKAKREQKLYSIFILVLYHVQSIMIGLLYEDLDVKFEYCYIALNNFTCERKNSTVVVLVE